jgi:hypothetical protein
MVEAREISILGEPAHITASAGDRATVVVTLGPLLFFSTSTGDAWVLDPEDSVARCLAREGEALPTGITETAQNFSVEWTANYRIDGDVMIFAEHSGQVRKVMGYPVAEITRATERMRATR